MSDCLRRGALAGAMLLSTLAAAAHAAPSVERGRQIVQKDCGMCHAIGVKGASHNDMAPPFRTLGARYPIEMLEEALAEGIRTGHPAMPEFRFNPAEIDDLIAYIKSVQPRAQASLTPGRARAAR